MIMKLTAFPDELLEADVLWPERRRRLHPSSGVPMPELVQLAAATGDVRRRKALSAPIAISRNPERSGGQWASGELAESEISCWFNEDGGGVEQPPPPPPHVVAERSRAAKGEMAFSVCTGRGRTLKGRDLRQVRNSVLRLTGFLERERAERKEEEE
ncbi:hypothetical protein AXF42_Ash005680 [Apostasia shenzhenica]|uniref:Uncharacterized protein n=1 Tax=Apostasia shenzhenica TaxID=1088818 RepID=A0A2I0BC31_9ASPA|nr:hypothetical protein AXF42_Ash005680 [Apostasia shenzhenica]